MISPGSGARPSMSSSWPLGCGGPFSWSPLTQPGARSSFCTCVRQPRAINSLTG
jgi:hypothetical protein